MTNFQLKSLMGTLAGLGLIPLDEAVAVEKKLSGEQVPATVEQIAAQVTRAHEKVKAEAVSSNV